MKSQYVLTLDRCPWCHQPYIAGAESHETDASRYYAWLAPQLANTNRELLTELESQTYQATQDWISRQNEAMKIRKRRRFILQAALILIGTAAAVAAAAHYLYFR
jgi:hypothetical protein